MGKKKKRTLTPRRAKLLQEMMKGGTLANAGVAAGYSSKNAAQSAYQALKHIQKNTPKLDTEAKPAIVS